MSVESAGNALEMVSEGLAKMRDHISDADTAFLRAHNKVAAAQSYLAEVLLPLLADARGIEGYDGGVVLVNQLMNRFQEAAGHTQRGMIDDANNENVRDATRGIQSIATLLTDTVRVLAPQASLFMELQYRIQTAADQGRNAVDTYSFLRGIEGVPRVAASIDLAQQYILDYRSMGEM